MIQNQLKMNLPPSQKECHSIYESRHMYHPSYSKKFYEYYLSYYDLFYH